MLDNLYDLNKTVHAVAQRILEHAAERTQSGSYYVDHDVVADLISYEDYLEYSAEIEVELAGREEILDVEFVDGEFSLNIGLNWCPNYQWCEGDEGIFGMSQAEWERTFQAQPISKPMDANRLAEIGEKAITYVLESSDTAIEDLTERLGMSIAELEQLGIYSMIDLPPVYSFRVVDDVAGLSSLFQTFDEALSAYNELNSSNKYVAAFIPDTQESIPIMEQQGKYDILCNTRTDLTHIKELRDQFVGTPVDDAFQRAQQYMEEKYPILFYVHHDMQDLNAAAPHACFETALDELRSSGKGECSLGYLTFDEEGRGKGGILLQSDELSACRPCAIADRALKNPHIALAHAKAILSVYPNNEEARAIRDDAESKLGIAERTVDTVRDLHIGNWRVQYIPPGGHYGSHNQLVNDSKRSFVQFYDTSQDPEKFPNGQSTGVQYYVSTLLECTDYPFGLRLDFDIPSWTVSREEM